MTVRAKLALTVFATGLVTALLVIATVLYAFQRFAHESTYRRGSGFLMRVVVNNDYLFETWQRDPARFRAWLRNMVLFEPDTQLYLLGLDGTVLASSGDTVLAPGFKVALAPVLMAVGRPDAPYVMGDDPERMDAGAVVAVQPVRAATMQARDAVVGYLYLVAHGASLPQDRWAALRMSFGGPALGLILAIVGFATLVAVLIIVSVTRPLRRLTAAVSLLSREGLEAVGAHASAFALPAAGRDEFGQLAAAFRMLLETLHRQWDELRRLDRFRREGVANLSHDLRSPLTATAACLETLEGRWSGPALASAEDGAPAAVAQMSDRRLLEVALRNTRNAARLVQSLGDLAKLDEPEFALHPQGVDLGELLDDIALRFAERARLRGIELAAVDAPPDAAPAYATLDIELFERAVANLVDNALKFCPPGARVRLTAARAGDGATEVTVVDDGPGIAAAHLPQLFDRYYRASAGDGPAAESGQGLGLAIVKRIVELHGGSVRVESGAAGGCTVRILLPAP